MIDVVFWAFMLLVLVIGLVSNDEDESDSDLESAVVHNAGDRWVIVTRAASRCAFCSGADQACPMCRTDGWQRRRVRINPVSVTAPAGTHCPFCRDEFRSEVALSCPDCRTLLHSDCAEEVGCTTFGCRRVRRTPGARLERALEPS